MKKICALLIVLLPLAVSAQVSTDSLWRVWSDARVQDSVRLEALDRLAYCFINNRPDSAQALAQIQRVFARQHNLIRWEARSLNMLGLAARFQSNFDAAMRYYEQSATLLEQVGDRNHLSAVYGNMADVHRLRSNFPKAIDCLSKCLKLAEETGDRKRAADAYVSIATIYYDEPGNNEKALEYLEKARIEYEKLKNERGMSLVYGNLSAIWLERGDYKQALLYTEKALALQQKLHDEHNAATSLLNRASILAGQGKVREALADFDHVLRIFKTMGDQEGIADAYRAMGDLWIQQGRYTEAIRMCENALRIAREIGGPNLQQAEACDCLYNAYQKAGNYQRALEYLEQRTATRDSLQQQETATRLKQMELERRSVADSLSLAKERFEVEKTLRRKDRNLGILWAAGLGVLVVALAFWNRMLHFQRRSHRLKKHSDELEKQQLLNEIALLRTQVNPHFLFNSLSILSSLVHVDANLSEQFIEQLSRSYRYILEQREQTLVTLRTELEFIRAYAFLLKIRFENKFDLQIALPEELLDNRKIAPLTLQLLVENAVKHNRMSVSEPLAVSVTAENDEVLLVKNPLQSRRTAPVSTGVGLKNITDRYALLTGKPVWAGVEGTEFVVKIPLLT